MKIADQIQFRNVLGDNQDDWQEWMKELMRDKADRELQESVDSATDIVNRNRLVQISY